MIQKIRAEDGSLAEELALATVPASAEFASAAEELALATVPASAEFASGEPVSSASESALAESPTGPETTLFLADSASLSYAAAAAVSADAEPVATAATVVQIATAASTAAVAATKAAPGGKSHFRSAGTADAATMIPAFLQCQILWHRRTQIATTMGTKKG